VTWLALAGVAWAAPLARSTEVFVDSGFVLDQPAVAFGAGHLWAPGPVRIGIQGAAGARATVVENRPQDPPFGLATVTLGVVPVRSDRTRVGLVALLDAAILPAAEEDCNNLGNLCRHPWWIGTDEIGMSFDPAAGVRLEGEGRSGGGWSVLLGVTTHQAYDLPVYPIPRLDVSFAAGPRTTFHAWAGRYGVALGLGRQL
jgi:hypothetical protein